MEKEAKFELLNVKGGEDYLPEHLITRNKIVDILKKHFQLFGFLPLETTMLCYHSLLSSKYAGGAEIMKEVYSLTDQGKRQLGLRYDLTVPFCKVIAMNKNLRMPFKRYEIGKVFRDGPVKLGRCREFYQCDIDAVGIGGQLIEAELMNLAVLAYHEIGIDLEIKYSNRQFLTGIIQYCGFAPELSSPIILIVDKLEKISKAELLKEIVQLSDCPPAQAESLINYLLAPMDELLEKFAQEPLVEEGLAQLKSLRTALETLGIEEYCSFSPSLARGLEIYTGSVWEVFDRKKSISSSLGGGGRYDKIITNFMDDGNSYPAVGMSFGLEPISVALRKQQVQAQNLVQLYLIPMDCCEKAMLLANKLRAVGVHVLVDMSQKKLKKSFSYANNEHIPYVAVLGENEFDSGKIAIKHMESGDSTSFSMESIQEIANFIQETSET